MACTSATIPEYLHRNGRPILTNFENDQRFYRFGNPIEFPEGTITALSCKWSFIINENDLANSEDPPLEGEHKYALIEEIRNYSIDRQKIEGNYQGWHALQCVPAHAPNECDYSHSEILIRHSVFEDQHHTVQIATWVCEYEPWQNNEYELQSKRTFYKQLRKDYRKDIIALFSHS